MLLPFARGYSWEQCIMSGSLRVQSMTRVFLLSLVNVEICRGHNSLGSNPKVERSCLQLAVDSLAVNAVIEKFQI